MIRSFADAETQSLYLTGRSRRLPPDIIKRAVRKLEYIDLATRVEDLRAPLGNRPHTLEGDRKGQYWISVNDQWRVCFHFIDGDAFEVEITDYH